MIKIKEFLKYQIFKKRSIVEYKTKVIRDRVKFSLVFRRRRFHNITKKSEEINKKKKHI